MFLNIVKEESKICFVQKHASVMSVGRGLVSIMSFLPNYPISISIDEIFFKAPCLYKILLYQDPATPIYNLVTLSPKF